jgi:hypothetical protein
MPSGLFRSGPTTLSSQGIAWYVEIIIYKFRRRQHTSMSEDDPKKLDLRNKNTRLYTNLQVESIPWEFVYSLPSSGLASSLRPDRESTRYFYLPVILLDDVDYFITFFHDLFIQFCTQAFPLLFLPLLSATCVNVDFISLYLLEPFPLVRSDMYASFTQRFLNSRLRK